VYIVSESVFAGIIITVIYCKLNNYSELLSKTFLGGILEYRQNYYDGTNLYSTKECKESFRTKVSYYVNKITDDNKQRICDGINDGFTFTVNFWNLNFDIFEDYLDCVEL
jgi:hypothetical protein